MAAVTGKGGTILYKAGSVASIGGWSIDVDNAMHDITAFSTAVVQWREFAAGLSGWTGSIDGVGFDSASTGMNNLIVDTLSPTTATVVLEIDKVAGGKLTGSVFLSAGSFGADIDGMSNASWTMQGTGAVAFTTST